MTILLLPKRFGLALAGTVDAGSTTFTLLIPRVNLRSSDSAQIETDGITTLHKSSIIPPNGQTEFYTIHALRETTDFAIF